MIIQPVSLSDLISAGMIISLRAVGYFKECDVQHSIGNAFRHNKRSKEIASKENQWCMEENDAETCCLSSIGVGTQSTGMSSVSDCDGHFLERYPQSDFQSTLKFQIEDTTRKQHQFSQQSIWWGLCIKHINIQLCHEKVKIQTILMLFSSRVLYLEPRTTSIFLGHTTHIRNSLKPLKVQAEEGAIQLLRMCGTQICRLLLANRKVFSLDGSTQIHAD